MSDARVTAGGRTTYGRYVARRSGSLRLNP
jgi:hypothetical protein